MNRFENRSHPLIDPMYPVWFVAAVLYCTALALVAALGYLILK